MFYVREGQTSTCSNAISAKKYMKTNKPENLEKFPEVADPDKVPPIIPQRNDANIGNIVAAADPVKQTKTKRKPVKKSPKFKPKSRKKKSVTKKKLSTFRIVPKKR